MKKSQITSPSSKMKTPEINPSNPRVSLHRISLDGLNLTIPIPESKRDEVYQKLDSYRTKMLDSSRLAKNKQYKSNCFRKTGQYKDYLMIPIKTKMMDTYVCIGYRPIGKQNPLWVRFNPAHFTRFGYGKLKQELAKILGMRLLVTSFAKAIPTRLDVAVDIARITPDYLLADMRETRDSAIHLKGGKVSSMTMGTNRSTTSAIVYNKELNKAKSAETESGTRIEIRLRRMNSNKQLTFETLAKRLPANPFKRLDIYQVDETNEVSSQIQLVLAASRSIGLKGALQMLDQQEIRRVRTQLKHSKVQYFNPDSIWDEVPRLLKPLSILYTPA